MLAIVSQVAGCMRPVTDLELITPRQPMDRAIAEDLAAYADAGSGIRITLVPPPEGRSTLDALESGYGDLAFASNDQPFRPNVVTIMPLYPTVLHIVVRSERINDDFREMFVGARIFAGSIGSASRLLVERILKDLDIGAEEVSYTASPEEEPDVVVIYAAIQPDRVPDLPDYELLSFGEPEDIGRGSNIDRAILLNPRLRPFIIPVGTYRQANPNPVVTVAVDKLLVARTDMSEHVAYDLIREILRMRPALSGNRPTIFHALSEDIDTGGYTFAMHPGARAYLERNEPSWLERYSGIGEVLVALLVAAVSGVFAAINVYRRRRKNRIDVFYKDVYELLEGIDDSSGAMDKEIARDKLRALQKKAFDMLVAEKLAADESFRIFITLSNDAIRDLGEAPRAGGD